MTQANDSDVALYNVLVASSLNGPWFRRRLSLMAKQNKIYLNMKIFLY